MSEPWETITAYGNVDMTLHPVLRECYRVACLIERCGASEDLTRASSAAFDLCGKVQELILNLCSAGIADQADAARYRFMAADADRCSQLINDTYDDWNTNEPWSDDLAGAIDAAGFTLQTEAKP